MAKSKPIELKDLYKLWWQYLTRSNRYKEFCEIVHHAELESSGDESIMNENIEKLYRIKWAERGEYITGRDYSDPWELFTSWELFGDVFKDDFETWWNENENGLKNETVLDLSDPDAPECIPYFTASLRNFKKNKGDRLPTSKEILSMMTSDREYIFVAIPVYELTAKDISKEVNAIRNKRKLDNKGRGMNRIRKPTTSNKKYEQELERYLKAYDDHQCIVNDSGVMKKPSPDVRRAMRIIENVEKFIFPGPYQPVDQKVK